MSKQKQDNVQLRDLYCFIANLWVSIATSRQSFQPPPSKGKGPAPTFDEDIFQTLRWHEKQTGFLRGQLKLFSHMHHK